MSPPAWVGTSLWVSWMSIARVVCRLGVFLELGLRLGTVGVRGGGVVVSLLRMNCDSMDRERESRL